MSGWNPWICVCCKSAIRSPIGCNEMSIVCPGCSTVFPMVGHETPVFVRDPDQIISDTCAMIERQSRAMRAKLDAIARKAGGRRQDAINAILEGLTSNLNLIKSLQEGLVSKLSPDGRVALMARVEQKASQR